MTGCVENEKITAAFIADVFKLCAKIQPSYGWFLKTREAMELLCPALCQRAEAHKYRVEAAAGGNPLPEKKFLASLGKAACLI